MSHPSTTVSRLPEKQRTSRTELDELLDSTPLATIALIRDGHPVIFPIGFARIGDELVIHGSTGSPWLRQLADGAAAAVSVTTLDGVMVARCGFESSFRFRSAVLFGTFERIGDEDKVGYLDQLVDTFIPGRVAELRASSRKELAATMALRMPIADDNWSLKVGGGWPEDSDEDIAAGVWAGVVPLTTVYGDPERSPDCDAAIPVPPSVRAMRGPLVNRRPG
ncbi:MAG: pyridoxamine 5'-phosphate oxidase family protein [Mycolicibacterium sp.]|jgi:nitroimidazol reductase NimA-like FMN-containing flavoprotein (pyridoxamine 5'-phosphate oxidase superfamily)|nr:pyridoxamine 5'-phosphate oxidase family protein [Mycobacterium sp.]MCB9442371.1 pyridoxamine 5'-phosphate oxidase family protein [Mycolicibacterium sp.]HNA52273.1 pyridoxamine 5'-phosphate oxidase family protein [Mycobacterium sp.]